MKLKKGISLILLVITIIVIIILAGAVVLSLSQNNPITEAEKATFLNDLNNFQSELELYQMNQILEYSGDYSSDLLGADKNSLTYDGIEDVGKTIYDVIPSLQGISKYEDVIKIANGKLIYAGSNNILKLAAESIGIATYTNFSSDGLVDSGINYTETTNSLINPERGFYQMDSLTLEYPYSDSALEEAIDDTTYCTVLAKDREISIGLFKINLENYKENDIPNEWLSGLNTLAELYRNKGMKIIVRFNYGNDAETFSDPNDFEQIITHIDQLEDFFTTNEDIIYVVEAGFLGPWGEWHSTIYDDDTYRIRIIDKLLEVIPESRTINLRTPEFYRMKFGESPFDETNGYSTLDEARVGNHNDAFLSSLTDMGTYDDEERSNELAWLSSLTKYTIFGGESIMDSDSTNIYNDTSNAISEMTTLHAQYLNYEYDQDTMNKWQSLYDNTDSIYNSETTYKLINDRLGYRFVLKDSKLPTSIESGEDLNISVDIENTGFGNLVNYRNAYLLLEKDQKYYKAKIDVEVRRWFAGETTKLEMVFQIPGNIDLGTWKAYIQIPDYNEDLTHENFFVKFANDSVWNSIIKANYIGSLDITAGSINNDNKFYQLNTYNMSTESNNLIAYTIPKTIDGNNTDDEWNETNKIYSESGYDIYMDNDEESLYIYVDTDLSVYNYIALYFDNDSYLEGNKFDDKYKFLIEKTWGGYIYNGIGGDDWSWNKQLSSSNYTLIQDTGYEYEIPLTYLQVYTPGTILQNIFFKHHRTDGGDDLEITGGDSITYTIK